MKRFYFAGHTHFGNRGCEALIRSTVTLLRREFGDIQALVPSADPARDAAQWPGMSAEGVHLVPAPAFPDSVRWWHRTMRALPVLKGHWLPNASPSPEAAQPIERCDAIVMTGGDIMTLDYGLPSLIWNARLLEPWFDRGKPAILWGASVGPFTREPAIEAYMAKLLSKVRLLTVRETISADYLRGLGLGAHLTQVTDPAFNLLPEPVDCAGFWPRDSGSGVLGFNVSPLIQKFRPAGERADVLRDEIVTFLRHVIDGFGQSVLLLPHVDPLDGQGHNSDSHFMRPLLAALSDRADRIALVPPMLNAAQLKHVLGRLSFFIGARTHATIGALSSGVPTLSIAYSIKARGINRDLFGDERWVVPTPKVSAPELKQRYGELVAEAAPTRERLAAVLPAWREKGAVPARLLRACLESEVAAPSHA